MLLPLCLVLAGCKTTLAPVTITKTEVTVEPKKVEKLIDDNFTMIVEPVDNNEINQECFEFALRSGALVGEATFFDTQRKSKRNPYILYLDYLVNEGWLNRELYNHFLISRYPGINSSSNYISSGYVTAYFNPFANKRLSVIRVCFTNESPEVKKILRSNIIVNSRYEQLSPLSTKYFDTIYKPNTTHYNNVLRMNMPNVLVVPPGQTVVKYIAIPALSNQSDGFSVSLISGTEATQFSFKQNSQRKSYECNMYKIKPKTIFANAYVYPVILINDTYIPCPNDYILVRKEDVDSPISVYSICNWGREFELGIREDFKLSECKNSTVTTKVYYFKAFKKSELGQ